MASPTDLGFDLLPPDPGLLNPDLALEAALAPVVELGTPEPAALGKGWSFDFLTGRFFMNGSSPAEVYGVDNLRMWIEKTLRTARYAHPIYSTEYGVVEPNRLIGEPYDPALIAQWQDAVVNALIVHDRIAAVDDFYFEHDPMGDTLFVSFTVTLDSDDAEQVQVSSFPLSEAAR